MNDSTPAPTMSEETARVLIDFDRELERGTSEREARVLKEARAALDYYKALKATKAA